MVNTLGELIKSWREEAGLSQLLLSKAIKKSEKAISHFETNRYPPSVETIERIVKALNRGQDDKLLAMTLREPELAKTGLFKIAEGRAGYSSRHEARLHNAFSRLTAEAQERYIKMMEVEAKALDKS